MKDTTTEPVYARKPDEISIRSLILTSRDMLFLVIRRWYLILLGALLLGGYQFYQFRKIKPTYPALVKLLVRPQNVANENKLLVQIYSKLINSRSLLEDLFLTPVDELKPDQLLINEYLQTYFTYKPEGLSGDIPTDFQFEHSELPDLNLKEKQVFKLVMDKVITPMSDFTDGFVSITTEDALGFITINISSPTEELSLQILELLVIKAEKLLVDNTVFAPKLAFKNLQTQTDSLAASYKESYYQLNKRRNSYQRELKLENPKDAELKYLEKKIHRLEADTEIEKTKYLASLEQMKIAQVDMDQKSLLIQQIERTYAPIQSYQPSAKRAAIKGAIGGGAFFVFLIVLFQIYRNVVAEVKESVD
ncbi:MAG: hypothetical protein AB8G22_17925 [Saprospiraceae bacterium]